MIGESHALAMANRSIRRRICIKINVRYKILSYITVNITRPDGTTESTQSLDRRIIILGATERMLLQEKEKKNTSRDRSLIRERALSRSERDARYCMRNRCMLTD